MVMNSKAILIRTGSIAAAVLAHAAFAGVLVAAQPRPEQYLARLAPPAAAPVEIPAGVELAQRGARPLRTSANEVPVVETLAPTRLLRGTRTC
jgi:hypothetical protein